MKRIQNFENWNTKNQYVVDTTRNFANTKLFHITTKIGSIIDDLIHLNFNAAKHSLKNKTGYNKLEKLVTELGILKKIYLNDDTLSYQDLEDYKFNPFLLDVLQDPDVIEYMKNDPRVQKTLDKIKNLIDFLNEYKQWHLDYKKSGYKQPEYDYEINKLHTESINMDNSKLDNIKEYLLNIGFEPEDQPSDSHFYMNILTPNHNHIDVQYNTENDRLLMRLIGRKHVEEEYEINDWSENYIDDLQQIQDQINEWEDY